MSDVQIAVIDQQDTQIVLAVPGVQGATGSEIPAGGTADQVLRKNSSTDYDTNWSQVTSAMIANGAIVNEDVNNSAAIAGTKISPDFGGQAVTTTGQVNAARVNVTGNTAPSNGIYLPSSNNVAISTNGTGRLFVDSSGNVGVGASAPISTNSGLDISSGGLSLVVGANNNQSSRTDATLKTSRIASFHYTNAEKPVAIVVTDSTPTSNLISFGGSTSLCTAATNLAFYTAANNTTATGSERMRIDSSGRLGLGSSVPVEALTTKGSIAVGDTVNCGVKFYDASPVASALRWWLANNPGDSDALSLFKYDASGNYGGNAIKVESNGSINVDGGGLYYDASTNRLAVGTTGPSELIHGRSSGDAKLFLQNTTGNSTGVALQNDGQGSAGLLYDRSANTLKLYGPNVNITYANASQAITFNRGVNESARIDSSGRLLVGTSTAPTIGNSQFKFNVSGESFTDSASVHVRYESALPGPTLIFAKARGTAASPSIVQDDDQLGRIRFYGYDSNNFSPYGAEIAAQVDGTPAYASAALVNGQTYRIVTVTSSDWSAIGGPNPASVGDTFTATGGAAGLGTAILNAGNMPGRLVFSTTADGASSPTERMRITSDAYVRLAAGSGGIQFNGDTAAANALDDYEEGTWTPTLVPATGSFASITYDSTRSGYYTKVGNLVTVWGLVRTDSVDATGASGLLSIGGLPFTVGTGTYGGGYATSLLNWAGEYPNAVRPNSGTSTAYLGYRTSSSGADAFSDVTDLTTGTADANRISFQFSYRV